MIKVGLSGNRYSGKDRIAKLFEQIGIPVFHADIVLKFILNYNYEVQGLIADKIGRSYFTDGVLNIDKVKSGGVFDKVVDVASSDLLKAFEKFMSKNTESIYCVFHSSILFERGWDKTMDYNVNVFSPTNDRMERCKFLTGKTVSSIYNLAQTEVDDLEKNRKSDFVVHNYNEENPAIGDILSQVSNIDQKVIDDYLELERKMGRQLTPDGKGIILSHY